MLDTADPTLRAISPDTMQVGACDGERVGAGDGERAGGREWDEGTLGEQMRAACP
jgi:hypothetical protein